MVSAAIQKNYWKMQNSEKQIWLSEFLLTQLSMTSLILQGIWCDCTWFRHLVWHLFTALDCVDPKGCTCPWKLKLPDRKLYLGHKFDISPVQMSKRLEGIICCQVVPGCWASKGTYRFWPCSIACFLLQKCYLDLLIDKGAFPCGISKWV